MPTIKTPPYTPLSTIDFYNHITAIQSSSSFNLSDLKPDPEPKNTLNDTTTDQAVPIASLQFITNIREQKEKSQQLQQQKRKPPRDR